MKKTPIFAPFYILRDEKLYISWLVTIIFFGLLNVWAGLLMGDLEAVKSSFSEGIVYTYLISICAPFIAETLLYILVKSKSKEKIEFISYKILSIVFNLFLIFFLSYIWVGRYKGVIWLQILIGIIVSLYSFYMFCVDRMNSHKTIVGEYDHDEYLNSENKDISNLINAASEVEAIKDEDGDIKV